MASPNSTFTEIVSTTLRGRLDVVDGGYEIVCPLEYAENSTYQRYSGYDTLDVSASDVLSAAKYDWKQSAVHVSANGLELRQNSGKNQLINLAKSRIKNAMNTFANNLSTDVYSDGTAANQINGLQALVADAGTGTVGGINSSTYTFWKNIVQSAASPLQGGSAITPSASTIKSLMQPLWLALVRGNDAPDLIVSGATYFQYYWDSLTDLQRYSQSDSATQGFQSLKFVTADVIHDGASWGSYNSGLSDTRMYFLNTDYLGMTVHKAANMTEVPEKRSVNQDAAVIPIIWQGNLTCSNRSLQGIVKA
jgi:hypothetical protein